jgi:hypothetical protein
LIGRIRPFDSRIEGILWSSSCPSASSLGIDDSDLRDTSDLLDFTFFQELECFEITNDRTFENYLTTS